MDIFDLIGPIMVGPSSSHTAGAVRIGLVGRRLLGEDPVQAQLLLHGSFAATGRGHGTDRALVAGLLGLAPDDGRIPDSFQLAGEQGLSFCFGTVSLRSAHPNSVQLTLDGKSGRRLQMTAASIGGGRIQVRELDGMPLCFSAEQPGSVADVSRVLARLGINIATFQVNRNSRGGEAVMVIECDAPILEQTAEHIRRIPGILDAVSIKAV